MSDFKQITINTQEELDAMFKERVERAKKTTEEKLTKEFEGFSDFKAKAEKYDTDVNDLTARLDAANTEKESYKVQVSELNAKVKQYEMDSVKTKLCNEFGLSLDLANRLNGNNEDELRADAQALQKIVGTVTTAPLGSTEPVVEDDNNSYKSMIRNIRGEN